jgi:threonine/homoserine/homoserine lactone efflux protein
MLASATAFTLLKWLGAAYLVYVGLRMLFSRAPQAAELGLAAPAALALVGAGELKTTFMRGFWTNALNPKVALFFLAFLPQFIAPTVEHKPLAFLLLGLLFNFNAVWVNLGWACAAVWLARKAGGLQARMHWLDRAAGALFIAFGLRLAFTANPSS